MKKKNLKNLSVKKSTISNLNKTTGGAAANTLYAVCGTGPGTIYIICGTGPLTIYSCPSIHIKCEPYNSVNRCKTIEVDANTLPIC